MPRRTRGSIYRSGGDTFGIRWQIEGKRTLKGGFESEDAARQWFAQNVLSDAAAPCAEMRRWARRYRAEEAGWVYVIASHDAQRIKIGRTTVPDKRLRDLRTAAPVQLTPLFWIPGGERLETKMLHLTAPFAARGAGSEWRTMEALEVVLAFVRERATSGTVRLVEARRRGVVEETAIPADG